MKIARCYYETPRKWGFYENKRSYKKGEEMTVREHIGIIDNPVVLAIEEKDVRVVLNLRTIQRS